MFSLLSHRPARSSRRNVRLHLEALEDRSVPSVLGNSGPWFPHNVGPAHKAHLASWARVAQTSDNPAETPVHSNGTAEWGGYNSKSSPGKHKDQGLNWMNWVNDQKLLSQLNIPGTHDSGARYSFSDNTDLGFGKAQSWSIMDQLKMGIRYLDIRLRHLVHAGKHRLVVHHDYQYQYMNFDHVLRACVKFLKAHPTECIIMQVKEEYTSLGTTQPFADTFNNEYRKNAEYQDYWFTGTTIPTLGQVRGKIVLVARADGIGGIPWPKGGDDKLPNSDLMKIQDVDNCNHEGTWWYHAREAKWHWVQDYLNLAGNANSGDKDKWFINFTSGWCVTESPYGVAQYVNEKLLSCLRGKFGDTGMNNGFARLGTIVMDFPGDWVIREIFYSNFANGGNRLAAAQAPQAAPNVNSLAVAALPSQPKAVGTAHVPGLSVTAAVRDLAFLPQHVALTGARLTLPDPGGSNLQTPADHGGTDPLALADVQGVLFGDRDRDGVCSDGEPPLSDRVVRLVDANNAVVAETRTGAEGEYRFVEVPAGRYQVETEPSPEWAGTASPAFTVVTEPVTVDPLGLPPAEDAPKEGAPSEKEPATPEAVDAAWSLLGMALPAFRSREERRSATVARRRGF
jgi:hypothetical protein